MSIGAREFIDKLLVEKYSNSQGRALSRFGLSSLTWCLCIPACIAIFPFANPFTCRAARPMWKSSVNALQSRNRYRIQCLRSCWHRIWTSPVMYLATAVIATWTWMRACLPNRFMFRLGCSTKLLVKNISFITMNWKSFSKFRKAKVFFPLLLSEKAIGDNTPYARTFRHSEGVKWQKNPVTFMQILSTGLAL